MGNLQFCKVYRLKFKKFKVSLGVADLKSSYLYENLSVETKKKWQFCKETDGYIVV